MGLDNIPKNYPCKANGTAVMDKMIDQRTGEPYINENGETVDQINCDSTMECGGCPWKVRLGDQTGSVLGILGTHCWYRGKYGVRLLSMLDMDAEALYGDENQEVTVPVLRELIAEMDERVDYSQPITIDGDDIVDDYRYLRDWMEFVADECGGAVAWY